MNRSAIKWLYDQIELNKKSIYSVIDRAKQMEEENNDIIYLSGTIVGILAGITIGWIIFA